MVWPALIVPLLAQTADYPDTNAVLVRRHGVYIFGKDWIQTKTFSEVYHYLFEMACKMIQAGLDPVQQQ